MNKKNIIKGILWGVVFALVMWACLGLLVCVIWR